MTSLEVSGLIGEVFMVKQHLDHKLDELLTGLVKQALNTDNRDQAMDNLMRTFQLLSELVRQTDKVIYTDIYK